MPRTLPAGPLAVLAAAALVSAIGAQSEPALRIAAPTENTYLSGPARLVAVIEPASGRRLVERITFFADGKQICEIFSTPYACDWDAGDGVVEHQIRVVATLRDGRRLVQNVRTKGLEYAEAVDVDVVQVTAVVIDADGRFVRGLKQEDFKVFEDGRPQQITSFASENIPLELVAAIDVSSSMRDALPRVKESAKRFLTEVQAGDQVTVLAFNDNIFTLARRATAPEARARAIDRMAPWGGTALYDVIIRAIDVLGRQPGRRSVVLFSDGDDQSSHAPLQAAIDRTEGSDATIYAVGQGRAVTQPELQALMTRIASVSGGRAFFTEDPRRLDAIFSEILEDLRNQYVLGYPAPSTARDGAWHAIRVEVAGGKYRVRARQGYRLTRHD